MITMLNEEMTQRVLARIAHLDFNEKMGVLYGLGLNPYWKSVMTQITSKPFHQAPSSTATYGKETVPDGTVLSSIKFGHYTSSVMSNVSGANFAPSYSSMETLLFNHQLPSISGSVTFDKVSVDTFSLLLKLSLMTWSDFKPMDINKLLIDESVIPNANGRTVVGCSSSYRSDLYSTAKSNLDRRMFIGDAIPSGVFKNFVRALLYAKCFSQNSNLTASVLPISRAFGYPDGGINHTTLREGNFGLGFWFHDFNELFNGTVAPTPMQTVIWNPKGLGLLPRYSDYFSKVVKAIIPLRAELIGLELGKDQMAQSWKVDMIEEIRELTSLNQNILSIGVTTREQVQILKNNITKQISELE